MARPKSTLSRGPIVKPHYMLHSWTRSTYDAKRHPDPIRRFPQCTGKSDARTHRQTDRPRESLMTIGRFYASNNNKQDVNPCRECRGYMLISDEGDN